MRQIHSSCMVKFIGQKETKLISTVCLLKNIKISFTTHSVLKMLEFTMTVIWLISNDFQQVQVKGMS